MWLTATATVANGTVTVTAKPGFYGDDNPRNAEKSPSFRVVR